MVNALKNASITYWYDEAEIKWGDSITQKVNEGLSVSRFVIVVLSKSFISKNWPQREMNSALNIEATSGEVRVLPLLAGTQKVREEIIECYPILNDKKYLIWENGINLIISALKDRLGASGFISQENIPSTENKPYEIPLPRIRKKYTQRDKDLFLKSAFETVKDYFQRALESLQTQYPEVETDLSEIHKFKFTATTYVHGEIRNRCKIWVGGPISSNAITYQEGDSFLDSDNSYNDWLSVADEQFKLGFEVSGMWIGSSNYERGTLLSPEEAAEYLWRRFTGHLTDL
jgi:hypothetical protein